MCAASTPPEFFADRNLGKRSVALLRERGWRVTMISDIYPEDAQDIADDVWMAEGCGRGWSLITKDQKIRYREDELAALSPGSALFCLATGNLLMCEMVDAFEAAKTKIHRAIEQGDGGFWHVYASGT